MNEVDRLSYKLVALVRDLEGIVDRLQDLRYPSTTSKSLLDLILRLARAVEEEALRRLSSAPKSPKDLAVEMKLAIAALQTMGAHLRFVERATTDKTPAQLVRPLEKLGARMHEKAAFLVRPQWRYNYSILELVSQYQRTFQQFLGVDKTKAACSGGSTFDRLYVIGFPFVDRQNVLLHPLFGHELGHPVEREYFDQEDAAIYHGSIMKACLDYFKAGGAKQTVPLEMLTRASEMSDRIRAMRNRALAELTCDMVLGHLFGPAGLFAMEELAASREIDGIPDSPRYYPPWRFRLRAVAGEISDDWIERFLSSGEFSAVTRETVKGKVAEIRALVAATDDQKKLDATPETKIAYGFVNAVLANVRDFVQSRLESRKFRLDDLLGRTHRRLLDRLDEGIPPDGGAPGKSDARVLFNVAWLRYLTIQAKAPLPPRGEEAAKHFRALEALNRLVLKAFEYCDLWDLWAARS